MHQGSRSRFRHAAEGLDQPARDAELSDGDLLIAMDGGRLTQPQQLAQAVARSQPGAKLKLRLRRGSSESDKTIELGVHPGEGEVMRRLLVGRAAPDLGNTITVQGVIDEQASKWRGNVVVLEFWASWCVSCKALAPDLARWHRSWASRGLKLIGIASDQPALAHEATKSWAIPYPVVADPAEQSAAGYAVSAFPTLVVIDRAGVVRDVMIGYDQKRRAEIERVVELLLAH